MKPNNILIDSGTIKLTDINIFDNTVHLHSLYSAPEVINITPFLCRLNKKHLIVLNQGIAVEHFVRQIRYLECWIDFHRGNKGKQVVVLIT